MVFSTAWSGPGFLASSIKRKMPSTLQSSFLWICIRIRALGTSAMSPQCMQARVIGNHTESDSHKVLRVSNVHGAFASGVSADYMRRAHGTARKTAVDCRPGFGVYRPRVDSRRTLRSRAFTGRSCVEAQAGHCLL